MIEKQQLCPGTISAFSFTDSIGRKRKKIILFWGVLWGVVGSLTGCVSRSILNFRNLQKKMDLGWIDQAITEKQVDLVAGSAKDAVIDMLGLTVLEDDKSDFPPYETTPIFDQETLNRYPQLNSIL